MADSISIADVKVCSKCGEGKPANQDFFPVKRRQKNTTKLDARCKTCKNAFNRAYWKERKEKDPEYCATKEKKDYWKQRYDNNKERWSNSGFISKYGISLDEYNGLCERQNNKCYICGIIPNGKRHHNKLFVDHNHTTGKIRKLLCHSCNASLGLCKENIEILRKMIMYLEEYK